MYTVGAYFSELIASLYKYDLLVLVQVPVPGTGEKTGHLSVRYKYLVATLLLCYKYRKDMYDVWWDKYNNC
jgi:hypothetical protein